MPTPIFLEADLYGPLQHAAVPILFALFFPPGTFSNDQKRIPRWPWIMTIVPSAVLYTVVDIVLIAYRRGAEAAGQSGLPYRLAEILALAAAFGLGALLFRRLAPPKPQ